MRNGSTNTASEQVVVPARRPPRARRRGIRSPPRPRRGGGGASRPAAASSSRLAGMAPGAVAQQQQRRRRPTRARAPAAARSPAGRRAARCPGWVPTGGVMRAAAHGDAPVPGERLRQHHLGVVSGARHHRDHGDRLRLQLVEHGVEPRLPLVEGDRDLSRTGDARAPPAPVGAPARWPPDRGGTRVRREPGPRSRGHRQRHQLRVGCSRPVIEVRRSARPMRRW